jgi:hypothetical protein
MASRAVRVTRSFGDTMNGSYGIRGKHAYLARQIGRNELLAIDAVTAIANAEELYAQQPRDGDPAGLYTTKIFSTPGKQDGLYWPVPEGEPASPLGRVETFAKDALSTPNESPFIDGYSFRILTTQAGPAKGGAKQYIVDGKMTGGFAVIASPVRYGDSGVMRVSEDRYASPACPLNRKCRC